MGSAGIKTFLQHLTRPLRAIHRRLPSQFLKKVPFEAFAIIVFLILVNVVAWVVCLIVLVSGGTCLEFNTEDQDSLWVSSGFTM